MELAQLRENILALLHSVPGKVQEAQSVESCELHRTWSPGSYRFQTSCRLTELPSSDQKVRLVILYDRPKASGLLEKPARREQLSSRTFEITFQERDTKGVDRAELFKPSVRMTCQEILSYSKMAMSLS
jgi:hypothetical protein